MSMSTQEASLRANRVNSEIALGFENGEMVGNFLFPRVPHPQRAGQTIQFGREAFLLYNSERSPGSRTLRVDVGYEGDPFMMKDYSLEGKVPIENQEELMEAAMIEMAEEGVNMAMNAITLNIEYLQGQVATTAASYGPENKVTLVGSSQWSHADSTPLTQIETAREAIRDKIGKYPNTMILGPRPWNTGLKHHPDLVARLEDNNTRAMTTQKLGEIIEVPNVYVGTAQYCLGRDQDFVDVWGNYAILAYVAMGSRTRRQPSYGYTYHLPERPFAEDAYEDRNIKSTLYPVTDTCDPRLTGMEAGYLFVDCVAL